MFNIKYYYKNYKLNKAYKEAYKRYQLAQELVKSSPDLIDYQQILVNARLELVFTRYQIISHSKWVSVASQLKE